MQICKICLKKITTEQKYLDYHNTCLVRLFDSLSVSPTLSFDRTIFQSEVKKYVRGMSISGVQKKLSLKIENDALVLTKEQGTYILKPTVEDLVELAQNEHLSMLIGKALDIETPPLGLIKFSNGELVYLIKRFDWLGRKKIQKEDMTQIFQLNREENETYNYKYSQSYEGVAKKLVEVTGGKKVVALDFFNRLVYNYLIQNGDYHLKNISVVAEKLTKEAIYDRLAPNYDSVMTSFYSPAENEMALDFLENDETPKIHEEVGWFTRPDFEDLGRRIGLTTPATAIIFDRIRKSESEIFELISDSFLSVGMKKLYKEKVIQRLIKLGLK